MTSAPVVRSGRIGDRQEAVDVLRAGFFTDPISRWLIPDDDRRRSFHRGLFAAAFDDSLAGGALLVASIDDAVVGVAAWYPPGRNTSPSGEDMDEAQRALSDADRARLDVLRDLTAAHEPEGTHSGSPQRTSDVADVASPNPHYSFGGPVAQPGRAADF